MAANMHLCMETLMYVDAPHSVFAPSSLGSGNRSYYEPLIEAKTPLWD